MSSVKPLRPYSASYISSLTRKRTGEVKVGERVVAAGTRWQRAIEEHKGDYVLLGIPEDIGVRANLGRPGAHSAFNPALSAFLNQHSNVFFHAEDVLVLGEVECSDLMKKAGRLKASAVKDLKRLRELVSLLDERVTAVLYHVFSAGKIPLVIGGGHNNAYGIIRAFAQAKGQVNVINCDPHLDFRACEGRHSGNSFSYAFADGFLRNYAVVGMHEQYNSDHVVSEFSGHPGRLWFQSFESVFVRGEVEYDAAVRNCIGFVKTGPCGVEIDLDAVTNMPSSARTSSGISPLQARQYIHACGARLDCAWLHIAEAAPVLSHIRADMKTGKFIAYLITDFIKARGKTGE